ncbi:hypothetical protein SEMRO_3331_G346880.1 [Seminavis robusta]|uniref:Uncharacterized protein n=1 Tax=Seminavis robusta TaxID=568900 RepID=A0A9N8F020_9STRA|nr:hypothetical protein SEMRO_3331_G346880.1 [Seminavis robusta]|eukprot:Sro3331_g346880.1 n/a (162) ;mRNA; f:6064-6637
MGVLDYQNHHWPLQNASSREEDIRYYNVVKSMRLEFEETLSKGIASVLKEEILKKEGWNMVEIAQHMKTFLEVVESNKFPASDEPSYVVFKLLCRAFLVKNVRTMEQSKDTQKQNSRCTRESAHKALKKKLLLLRDICLPRDLTLMYLVIIQRVTEACLKT